MRGRFRLTRAVGLIAALAMILAACPADDDDAPEPPDVADPDDDVEPPDEIAFDIGVTEEPCPNAVNPDNGCIYLGQLSDLTVGPFAALAVPITDGMVDFWQRVNEQGGIGGFDVDVETYLRDNEYNPEVHVTRYREIEPNILALAQTLGTPPSLAALPFYDDEDVVAVAVTWWSGWEFEDVILQSGYNYCVESMNAIDYAIEEHGSESVMSVHYPGDYGEDSAVGARHGADETGLEWLGAVETLPNAVVGDQSGPIGEILRANPDLVIVATGPAEFAEIVGGAVARGFEGRFIGSVPTVNPGLLASPAGPALEAQSEIIAPWGPWGSDTEAHRAMQEARGDSLPSNDGYTFGWVWSYPMKAALEQAAANGDLTRQGLREAVSQMTVDYEGALPDKSYAGDPNETAVREALIARWDQDAPLGTSVYREFFVGPTAEGFDFTEPCTDPRA